jgi:hypothetical protein
MKDYGEINQWIFLYVYYFSPRGGHEEEQAGGLLGTPGTIAD